MYTVILAKRIEKFLDKLPSQDRERIIVALEKLRIRPEAYLKKLVGDSLYRFRVGDYRLIVDIQSDKLLVLIVDVGHRKNVYK